MPESPFDFNQERPCHDLAGKLRRDLPREQYPRPRDRAAGAARPASRTLKPLSRWRVIGASRKTRLAFHIPTACPTPSNDTSVTAEEGQTNLLIALAGTPIGTCGIDLVRRDTGATAVDRRGASGSGLCDRSGSRRDRPCLYGPRIRDTTGRRTVSNYSLAARAGEVWVPVGPGSGCPGFAPSTRPSVFDRFRLDRGGYWTSLKGWANARRDRVTPPQLLLPTEDHRGSRSQGSAVLDGEEGHLPRARLAALIATTAFGSWRSGESLRTIRPGAAYRAASVGQSPPWPLPDVAPSLYFLKSNTQRPLRCGQSSFI